MSLFAELKRRNVFRVGTAYAVVAWLLIQAADILLGNFGAPEWVFKSFTALLLLGFPLALFLSWAYELTPEGVKRATDVEAEQQVIPKTGKPIDRLIVISLLAVISILIVERVWFVGQSSEPGSYSAEASATLGDPDSVAFASVTGGLVAVLPFRNRSVRDQDAFFAEGIHDDLLTRLARVASLKVISRTSMMRYASSDKSVPEIARELGAAVVLEGAVQRAGDQVRVTVQLIDGPTDVHLWAESYDRALTTETIFSIQADIAQAVAGAMQVMLSPDETEALRTGSTDNLQAYEAFLRGTLLSGFAETSPERSRQAIAEFDRAIALDPDFAEAYARKATIQLRSFWLAVGSRSLREEARESVAQARRLAPDSIETLLAESQLYYFAELDYASADRALGKVLAQAPQHANAWPFRGWVARRDGRFDDGIAAFERSLSINPQAADVLVSLVESTFARGEFDASAAWLRRA